jgi:putative ABC transport system permease protein
MFSITMQDLRFRARQFLIAVGGAGLIFAMTLLLSGLAAGFRVEVVQTVEGLGAQAWAVGSGSGAAARIIALPPVPGSDAAAVGAEPGVRRVGPLIVVPQAAEAGTMVTSVNLIGILPHALGSPTPESGRGVDGNGQAVVDRRLGLGIGQHFAVGGHGFTVVGLVSDRTLDGGVANAYVTLGEAQDIVFGGRNLISGVLTTGVPKALPAGLALKTNNQIEQASINQLGSAVSSIDNTREFMWLIAAVIVAALIYVTALERTRDFAVLKALGSTSRLLFAGLATQAVVVALAAAAVGAVISTFMGGLFAQPVDIPGSAYVILPISALVVGLVASLAALRRAVSVDPAVAFAG